ncbi:MAG TPA: MFS transporter [Candidatus Baltobacteraceae bacterium]|nr:MFS transporter [Candidatus Baltobacteraceae bacterium]
MRKLPIALAVLGHTVVDSTQNLLPVVMPLLVDHFRLNYAQVGIAAALLNLSSSVIQPIFGWVSDRCPMRWFIPAGILVTGLFMSAIGLVPSYSMLLVLIACTGLGTAAFHPAASMAVAQASGNQRGFGMSFFSAGGNLGFAIGPVTAAWLLTRFGLHGTLFLFVPCCLMAAATFWWRSALVETERASKTEGDSARATRIPWGPLNILCAYITLRSWTYSGFLVFLPLLLHEQGVSLVQAGRALFVFLFFGAIGGMLGGYLSDRIGRQQVMAVSLLAFPFLMSAAILLSGPGKFVCLALAGAALLASFSVTVVFAQDLMPGKLGLASGLTLGLGFGTGGLGVGISGFLADALGLWMSLWLLILLPGIGGLLALGLRSRRR